MDAYSVLGGLLRNNTQSTVFTVWQKWTDTSEGSHCGINRKERECAQDPREGWRGRCQFSNSEIRDLLPEKCDLRKTTAVMGAEKTGLSEGREKTLTFPAVVDGFPATPWPTLEACSASENSCSHSSWFLPLSFLLPRIFFPRVLSRWHLHGIICGDRQGPNKLHCMAESRHSKSREGLLMKDGLVEGGLGAMDFERGSEGQDRLIKFILKVGENETGRGGIQMPCKEQGFGSIGNRGPLLSFWASPTRAFPLSTAKIHWLLGNGKEGG